jgi:hypothetical protein
VGVIQSERTRLPPDWMCSPLPYHLATAPFSLGPTHSRTLTNALPTPRSSTQLRALRVRYLRKVSQHPAHPEATWRRSGGLGPVGRRSAWCARWRAPGWPAASRSSWGRHSETSHHVRPSPARRRIRTESDPGVSGSAASRLNGAEASMMPGRQSRAARAHRTCGERGVCMGWRSLFGSPKSPHIMRLRSPCGEPPSTRHIW